jgi:hypothetical protein
METSPEKVWKFKNLFKVVFGKHGKDFILIFTHLYQAIDTEISLCDVRFGQ